MAAGRTYVLVAASAGELGVVSGLRRSLGEHTGGRRCVELV